MSSFKQTLNFSDRRGHWFRLTTFNKTSVQLQLSLKINESRLATKIFIPNPHKTYVDMKNFRKLYVSFEWKAVVLETAKSSKHETHYIKIEEFTDSTTSNFQKLVSTKWGQLRYQTHNLRKLYSITHSQAKLKSRLWIY